MISFFVKEIIPLLGINVYLRYNRFVNHITSDMVGTAGIGTIGTIGIRTLSGTERAERAGAAGNARA